MTMRSEAVSSEVITAQVMGEPSRFAFMRLTDFPLIPILILVGFAVLAIFANVLAPHDPEVGKLVARFKPPAWQQGGSLQFLLGTDHLGRDVLSRLIFGARVSLVVGFTAVIVAGVTGTLLGILSGFCAVFAWSLDYPIWASVFLAFCLAAFQQ